MKLKFKIVIITYLIGGWLLIGDCYGQNSSFTTLNLPSNGSTTAMGGYNISSTINSNSSFLQNPALFADSLNYQTTVNYTPYLLGISHMGISSALPVPYLKSVFFELSRTGYGTIEGYDDSGNPTETFRPNDYRISIGKSFSKGSFSLGTKLNFIHSGFQTYNANALSIDIGGVFTHSTKELRIALLLKNIGFTLSEYSEFSDTNLPFDVQLGTTYKPEFMPFRFTFTAYNLMPYSSSYIDTFEGERSALNSVLRYLNVGGELLFSENFQAIFGYNFKRGEELGLENTQGGAGLSLGFRIVTKKILIEYGRAKYHVAGANNQISLTFNLNNIIKSI